MQRKPEYSAKPGQIVDENGEKRAIYQGKPKSTVRNFDKYGDRAFSEKRRREIKKDLEAKMIIRTFKKEITQEINLIKQMK